MAPVRWGVATADVREGCCAFASKFYRVIARENEGNIVASPFSMHLMLTYLFHGSDGLSAKEIVAALCLFTVDGLREQYRIMRRKINGIQERFLPYRFINLVPEKAKIAVHLASAIFHQKNVQLDVAFKVTGSQSYNFDFVSVDFEDKNRAAQSINLWFTEVTKNEINSVLSHEDISNQTKVMMVSAMYLKVKWHVPFSIHHTRREEFFITRNLKKQVFMMQQMNVFQWGKIPSMKSMLIQLQYEEGLLDMVIIRPDEIEGLKFLEEHFDWNTIAETQRFWGLTDLRLPRFKIDTTVDLKSIRREMRLESIFEERGDFERMAKTLIDPQLKVDSIIQKVFLDVNEAGADESVSFSAERRVVTEIGVGLNVFIVNRPFMVVVRHISSNVPLFVASVRDIGEETTNVKREADEIPIVRRSSARLQAKRQKEPIKENELKKTRQLKGQKQQKKQKQS